MSETNIEWTDRTWNPTRGCSRVSAGCGTGAAGGCYAERQAIRHANPGGPYEGLVRLGKHGPVWTGVVRMVPEMLDRPLRWRKPQRIFVNSMSDLFHEKLEDEDIAAVFGVMAACPQHTFQVLTKRPERMQRWFQWVSEGHPAGPLHEVAYRAKLALNMDGSVIERGESWPLPNVWLGVSVEDQATADERIPLLWNTPSAIRFVSYEPALGRVDFSPWLMNGSLAWLIVGGESGPGARPFDIQWARSVINQCRAAGVPCFVKQLGAKPHNEPEPTGRFRTNEETGRRQFELTAETLPLADRKGGDMAEWPDDLRVRDFPKETWRGGLLWDER